MGSAMEADEKDLQHLSIRFWSDPAEDVCLIVCEPTLPDVLGLLDSLTALCRTDAPADLSTLALGHLQPRTDLPSSVWYVLNGTAHSSGSSVPVEAVLEDMFKKEAETTEDLNDLIDDAASLPDSPEKPDEEFIPRRKAKRRSENRRSKKSFKKMRRKVKVNAGDAGNPEKTEGDGSGNEEDLTSRPEKRNRYRAIHPGYISSPHSFFQYPEAQEMLERFAFRKKDILRGVRNAVCPVCQADGLTEMSLRKHLLTVHGHAMCKACQYIFPNLAEHDCPLQNIACGDCPRRFLTLTGWKLHRQKVHSGVRHVCHMCGRQLADINTLRAHLEARHGILPPPHGHKGLGQPGVAPTSYPCPKCGRQLKNRQSLREHDRRMHSFKARSGPCAYCGRIFCTRFSLKRHMDSVHRGQMEAAGDVRQSASRRKAELEHPYEETSGEEHLENGAKFQTTHVD